MAKISEQTPVAKEEAVCRAMEKFARDYLGWTPRAGRAYLRKDLLVVRLEGGLSATEARLLVAPGKGRDPVKEMRADLVEMARPILGSLVEEIMGVKVVSLHHDLSTVTGEEVIIFTLAEEPSLLTVRK